MSIDDRFPREIADKIRIDAEFFAQYGQSALCCRIRQDTLAKGRAPSDGARKGTVINLIVHTSLHPEVRMVLAKR